MSIYHYQGHKIPVAGAYASFSMIVRSHNTEFGYELISALPYAYWHHLNGSLEKTVSAIGSEPYYFFSPNHEIDESPRDFGNTEKAVLDIPNMRIHRPELDESQWVPPPIKDHYSARAITFDKPTVVIYNRYNVEWGKDPLNYFDLDTLRSLFDSLLPKYDIVYFNVRGQQALEDNAQSMDLGDYEMIANEYPDVMIIHDLVDHYQEDYNTVQLRIFAGCRKFITMNGGPSILASYFGGENIIYTKKCREVGPFVGSFHGWYHKFNPSDPSHVRVVRSSSDLIDVVRMAWIEERPLLNILVRCHNRPMGIRRLVKSAEQPGSNIRIIASYDNDATMKDLSNIPVTRIRVSPPEVSCFKPEGDDHRAWLGANEYLNTLMDMVTDGYIMFLDDDDTLTEGAIQHILDNSERDKMLLWRVQKRDDNLVPDDEHFGRIVAGQIAGIGVCFHATHKNKARWTPWRRGDYRFIRDMSGHIEPKFIDMTLTKMDERNDLRTGITLREYWNQQKALTQYSRKKGRRRTP